ncbi:hypothetical protein [Pseudomonas sp. 37 R 15]|uniref:hypothetical protein n=1 Tax=Pseudomonas sp. 37 R 15 TaxID=1844104 RepID=UPI0011119D37|nr:hypothetical protein [Pseudomonas sp. 37 R 15]
MRIKKAINQGLAEIVHGAKSDNTLWFPYMNCDLRNSIAQLPTNGGTEAVLLFSVDKTITPSDPKPVELYEIKERAYVYVD